MRTSPPDGEAHVDFLRQHPPYAHGAPGERWLTILIYRINPGLFPAAFSDWVRESWPDKAGLVAIDGIAGGPCRQWRRVSPRRFAAQPRCTSSPPSPAPRGWRRPPRPCPTRRTSAPPFRDWLAGDRRFRSELRLPGAACLLRAETCIESCGVARCETRYFNPSRTLSAEDVATAVCEHRAIENRLRLPCLHPDQGPGQAVTFGDGLSRPRKGHGARNMATVGDFALNLVQTLREKGSIKSRRERAGRSPESVLRILASQVG